MPIRERDQRALVFAGIAVAVFFVFRFGVFPLWDGWQDSRANLPLREKTLAKYRAAAASAALRDTEAASVQASLRAAEAGLLTSTTPALAFAEMQDRIKQLTAVQGIEFRSSDFPPTKALGSGYLQVPLSFGFLCRLDQLLNLISNLHQGEKAMAITRLNVQAMGVKEKLVNVSMTVAGVMRGEARPAGVP